METVLIIYVVWNVVTFLMMGIDKQKAKKDKWRISESALLTSAFAMGGVGSMMGSYVFRHKTNKMKFKILLPLSIIFNGFIMYLILTMCI